MTGDQLALFTLGAAGCALMLWQIMGFREVTFMRVAWVAVLAMAGGEGLAALGRLVQ